MTQRWYDVEDEEGVWRIGECLVEDQLGTKVISFDGFHPNFNTVPFQPRRPSARTPPGCCPSGPGPTG